MESQAIRAAAEQVRRERAPLREALKRAARGESVRVPPDITQRAGIYLHEAADLVTGDRANTHGDFILQHERAAKMIRAYILAKFDVDIPLRGSDVMRFLNDIKDSRIMTGGKFDPDHGRDQVGYSALRAVAIEEERK